MKYRGSDGISAGNCRVEFILNVDVMNTVTSIISEEYKMNHVTKSLHPDSWYHSSQTPGPPGKPIIIIVLLILFQSVRAPLQHQTQDYSRGNQLFNRLEGQ